MRIPFDSLESLLHALRIPTDSLLYYKISLGNHLARKRNGHHPQLLIITEHRGRLRMKAKRSPVKLVKSKGILPES